MTTHVQSGTTVATAGGATLSADGMYRYHLWRNIPQVVRWNRTIIFVLLNPSTADATLDDPTIRKCMAFARGWGGTRLDVVNLFAFRATSPKELLTCDDPIGPENDAAILQHASNSSGVDRVICAWGKHGGDRGRAVEAMLRPLGELYTLARNKDGSPKHPLYLRGDTQPALWRE